MSKKGLYLLATISTVVGSLWVLFNIANPYAEQTPSVCLFRNITGIPCPSCGSTHAVLKLLHMDWGGAIQDNPLGFILLAVLLVLPFWVLYDFGTKRSTFYSFYKQAEFVLRRRWVAIPLIVLVLANWMWNIYKYTA